MLTSVACLALVASAAAARNPAQTRLDFVMFGDPPLELPPDEYRFREGSLALWLAALKSPEGDLRQQAQRTLVWAHAHGMAGIEAAVVPLTQNLVRDDRLVVRLTAAQALVALDARQAAQALFDRAQIDGLDMAQLVEPALGRWGFQPLIGVWRRRLADERADRQRTLLAIRGLGDLRDDTSAEDLLRMADAAFQPADVRWAAATALGRIRRSGLEAASRRLRTRHPPASLADRLVAVRLLQSHDSPEAKSLLIEMAGDAEPAVVAEALQRLLELDPPRIVPLAERALTTGDVNVRRLVARGCFACPSAEHVTLLAGLLADPDPSLRDEVRRLLEQLAGSADWRADVVRQGERMLGDPRWTMLEQSVVLLTALDVASGRLVELLSHPRPEVYVAAAWGLRRLGAEQTLAPALKTARQRYEKREELLSGQAGQPNLDDQLAHLFEFFGQQKYQPAEDLLRSCIEKDATIPHARSAAIWALGFLHAGRPQPELVEALQERIKDVELPLPEHYWVRRFSAVTLGRMKAVAALPTLEIFREPAGIQTAVGYACAWSIEQISGQPVRPPTTAIKYHGGFFLEPSADEKR